MSWVVIGFVVGLAVLFAFRTPRSEPAPAEAPPTTAGPQLAGPWVQVEARVGDEVRLRFVAALGEPIDLPVEPLLAGEPGAYRRRVHIRSTGEVSTPSGKANVEDDMLTWRDGPVQFQFTSHETRPEIVRVAPFAAPDWSAPVSESDEAEACEGDNDAQAEAFELDPQPPMVCGLMEDAQSFGSDGTGDGLMGVDDSQGNLVMYWAGHDPFGIWLHAHSLAELKARGLEDSTPGGPEIHAMPACYLRGTPEEEAALVELGAHLVADFRGAEHGACYDEGVPIGDIFGRILLIDAS